MNFRLISLGATLSLAISSQAALTFLEVAQWSQFTQTSDAAPAAAFDHGFSARIFSNVANEVGSATVTTPGAANHALTAATFVSTYADFGFADMASVSSQYGPGTYGFAMNSGPYAGATDFVNYAGPVSFSETPFVSNFTAATSAPVDSSRTFQWSTTYTGAGTFTTLQTYFTLTDLTTNTTVFNSQGQPGAFGSATIAANTLTDGHTYRYQLLYGALDQSVSTAGFAPARRTGSTYLQTFGTFEAVPEPGSMAALGLGLAVIARRRAHKAGMAR